VFAPTDEAFVKLPEGTVESLIKDPAALAEILKYHVVSGKVMAHEVVSMDSAKTLQGSMVAIKSQDGKVWVNTAEVVKTDIECSNGVIHSIDSVLMPA